MLSISRCIATGPIFKVAKVIKCNGCAVLQEDSYSDNHKKPQNQFQPR